ncbi:hypothetical protein [Zophobihabitans entericus]|uniref:Uncharacterized protein n=1 Tax=Zophobihabitans entericus TaxID=1635327 RepID=A0A6G9IA38_9GAMM|nr:hypothetical protein [Zophobihabitans entericus]QIQ21098.1 hypothetical protein IPMB12_05050 [Zophobihabitans entericus]
MRSFVKCEPTFFSEINSQKEHLALMMPVETFNESQSYIKVPDRTDQNSNTAPFGLPVQYHGLTITGYYDSAVNLGKYGDYYFWGFIFNNSLAEIREVFSDLIWKDMEGELYIANPMIRHADDDLLNWKVNNDTVVGIKTIPAKGSTEKLLLLEKGPMVSMLCSIQGFVPTELLNLERPDIKQRPQSSLTLNSEIPAESTK